MVLLTTFSRCLEIYLDNTEQETYQERFPGSLTISNEFNSKLEMWDSTLERAQCGSMTERSLKDRQRAFRSFRNSSPVKT